MFLFGFLRKSEESLEMVFSLLCIRKFSLIVYWFVIPFANATRRLFLGVKIIFK